MKEAEREGAPPRSPSLVVLEVVLVENEPIVTLEKIRDELIVVSQKVRKGELTPNIGNAVVNALRSSAYVEQVRLQQEKGLKVEPEHNQETKLSKEDSTRLDEIVKLLSSEVS